MNLRRKLLAFLQSQKKDAEYTELEYLESTGTQWIDTGIEFQPIKAVIDLCYIENNTRDLMGYASYQTTYFGKTTTGLLELGGSYVLQGSNAYKWQEVEFIHNGKISGASCTLTTPDGSITRNGNIVDNLAGKNFCLFNISHTTLDYVSRVKISSAKFYNTEINKLIADLIPVLDKDFVPCMYDKVSGRFFYNQGTGEFKWKLPNQLEYLESTGTQYINTGFLSKELADKSLYIKMKTTGGTSSYAFNGAYHISGTGLTVQFGLLATSDTLCRTTLNHFDPSYLTVTNLQKSEYTEMMITPSEYWVNGEFKANHQQTSVDKILETNNPFLIFGRSQYNQPNSIAPMIISEFWIKDKDGKFVQYLIPAFDEDKNVCMYDLVSKTYLYNQGSGTFNYGGAINLFNPKNPSYVAGYITTTNNGSIASSTLTDTFYIPCKPNTTYLIGRSSVNVSGQVWRAATVSQTPYTGMRCPNFVGGLNNDLTLTITSGANDKYLMFSEGQTMATDDLTKFTIVESNIVINPDLVIASGVTISGTDVSGFESSSSNTITTSNPFSQTESIDSLEIVFATTHSSDFGYYHWLSGLVNNAYTAYDGFEIFTQGSDNLKFNVYHADGTKTPLLANTKLVSGKKTWIKLTYEKSIGYVLSFSYDGVSYNQEASSSVTKTMSVSAPIMFIGWRPLDRQGAYYWKGIIHLKEAYIKVNGKYIWRGIKIN